MYPFRRILIPTDFSTASEWVFDDAIRIAGSTGAEILILHIRMTWESHPDQLRFPADPSLYEYAEQQELERLGQRIARANAKITTRLVVRRGPDPGREIGDTASEENVDLIVMATHARHHVAHLLIGSTTLSVISNPPAPVLAIRYGIVKRTSMRTIVVPVNPRQPPRAAIDLAVKIAEHEGGSVRLMTICRDEERPSATETLKNITTGLPPLVISETIPGTDLEREIIRYAGRTQADVIFLNAEPELSDVKIGVLRHAPTPVMIVPGGAA